MAFLMSGAGIAARCCKSSPFATSLPSFALVSQPFLTRTLLSVQVLSHSHIWRRSQEPPQRHYATKPRRRSKLSDKIQAMRQEMEEHMAAKIRADELRQQRKDELIAKEQEEQRLMAMHDETSVEGTKQSTPLTIEASMSQGPYRAHAIAARSVYEETDELDRKARQELYSLTESQLLYRSPKNRWRLTLASTVMVILGVGLSSLFIWFAALTAEDSSWLNYIVALIGIAFGFTVAIIAWRRRSLYVKEILLIPTRRPGGSSSPAIGLSHLEVEVRGTSYVPFLPKTARLPLEDLRTNRRVTDCPSVWDLADSDYSRDRKSVAEYLSVLQPFVWMARLMSDCWTETRLLVMGRHGQQLTRLYTNTTNTAPLTAWNIDARGKFWHGPEVMDYLVEVNEEASRGPWYSRFRLRA